MQEVGRASAHSCPLITEPNCLIWSEPTRKPQCYTARGQSLFYQHALSFVIQLQVEVHSYAHLHGNPCLCSSTERHSTSPWVVPRVRSTCGCAARETAVHPCGSSVNVPTHGDRYCWLGHCQQRSCYDAQSQHVLELQAPNLRRFSTKQFQMGSGHLSTALPGFCVCVELEQWSGRAPIER